MLTASARSLRHAAAPLEFTQHANAPNVPSRSLHLGPGGVRCAGVAVQRDPGRRDLQSRAAGSEHAVAPGLQQWTGLVRAIP